MHQWLPPLQRAALAGLLVTAAPLPAFACASCGCSLSTDAAMGYAASPGWRLSLQYDAINQNELRTGSHAASPAQVVNEPTTGELEHQTVNRYVTLGLAYSPNADWNFSLLIPYIDRSHSSYTDQTSAPFDNAQLAPSHLSTAQVSGLGDIKFITAWQGLLPTHNLGLQLGVKLPTGDYGGANAAGTAAIGHHPAAFDSGPTSLVPSPGNLLDTSLQAGTGSTDLIIGAFYYQAVSQDFDAFVNAQFQAALAHRLDQAGQDYRPGNLTTMSFGLRDEANPDVVPQLQVNLTRKSADQGALADTLDTAGTIAYLSPGVSLRVAKGAQLYGFIQRPVYSRLDGYQLLPRWTATAGLSYVF
ncbi:hypothetical protein [Thiomonas sp. FB-Cd]|uniref:hypothetical protein n=1 Tax=Thiomonas sp. FB-Cd TaxID=1158292 RepID=UPI0004DF1B59|nr:hypothetical protein [Thiomonas sp. FB-Cd]